MHTIKYVLGNTFNKAKHLKEEHFKSLMNLAWGNSVSTLDCATLVSPTSCDAQRLLWFKSKYYA